MKFDIRFKQLMKEMAEPTTATRETMYYHGTGNLDNAIGIFHNGFKAREISSRKLAAPVKGKIYLTSRIDFAMIYAFRGHMAGHKPWKVFSGPERYAVVFEVPGSKLGDVQPDEDSVGEILKDVMNFFDKGEDEKLYSNYQWPSNMYNLKWFYEFARETLTPVQWRKVVVHDDEAHLWDAGKKLVSKMTDRMKLDLISMGAHIANEGEVIVPEKGWLIDKMESEKYSKDGSNFFQIAKPINKDELEKFKMNI